MDQFNLLGSILSGQKATNSVDWYRVAMEKVAQGVPSGTIQNVKLTDASGNPVGGGTIQISDTQPVAFYVLGDQELVDATTGATDSQVGAQFQQFYDFVVDDATKGTMNKNVFTPTLNYFGEVVLTANLNSSAPPGLQPFREFTVKLVVQKTGSGKYALMNQLKPSIDAMDKGAIQLAQFQEHYTKATTEAWADAPYYQSVATIVSRVIPQMKGLVKALRSIEQTELPSTHAQIMNRIMNPFQTVKDTVRNVSRGDDAINTSRKWLKDNLKPINDTINSLNDWVAQARQVWHGDDTTHGLRDDPSIGFDGTTKTSGIVTQIDEAFTNLTDIMSSSPSAGGGGGAPGGGGGGGRGGSGGGGGGSVVIPRSEIVTSPQGDAVTIETLKRIVPVQVATKKNENKIVAKKNTLAPKEWDLSFLNTD